MKDESCTLRSIFMVVPMRLRNVRSALLLFAQLVVPLQLGCTSIVESDRVQCSTTADCTRRGGAFASSVCEAQICKTPSPWSCLGNVTWPLGTAASVTVTLNMTDIITTQPVAGVAARICRKLDTSCAEPLQTDLISDTTGRIAIVVPQGFDGYVELAAPGAMRGSYFFYPPLTSDREIPSVPILQAAALNTFATLAGATPMTDRGHVMVRAYNCLGQTAEGVHFSSPESDDTTAPFYMIKGIPSTKQTQTDNTGQGGLLNLRPGSVTLVGKLSDSRETGKLSVFTRAGELTYTAVVPAP